MLQGHFEGKGRVEGNASHTSTKSRKRRTSSLLRHDHAWHHLHLRRSISAYHRVTILILSHVCILKRNGGLGILLAIRFGSPSDTISTFNHPNSNLSQVPDNTLQRLEKVGNFCIFLFKRFSLRCFPHHAFISQSSQLACYSQLPNFQLFAVPSPQNAK